MSSSASLSGTIAPAGYFLVQEAPGAGGTQDLPKPDAVGAIPMSATVPLVVRLGEPESQPGVTIAVQ